MTVTEPTPGAVYRYFDLNGALIYIGVTLQGTATRWRQHQEGSPWYIFVAQIDEEIFDDVRDAYQAETAAIEKERPVFNRAHNRSRESQVRLRQYLAEAGRLDLLPAVAMRLGRHLFDDIEGRLLARAITETDGNKSEMRRRLLLYALDHMPIDWNREITEDQQRGLTT